MCCVSVCVCDLQKLRQIEQLRQLQEGGEQLELNQVTLTPPTDSTH